MTTGESDTISSPEPRSGRKNFILPVEDIEFLDEVATDGITATHIVRTSLGLLRRLRSVGVATDFTIVSPAHDGINKIFLLDFDLSRNLPSVPTEPNEA